MHHILFSFAKHTPGKAIYGDKYRDAAAANIKLLLARDVSQNMTAESNRERIDRQAIEQAEYEGMIIHPSLITSTYKISEHVNDTTER
jgi:hypothetical protein